jgi:hypothetical protein
MRATSRSPSSITISLGVRPAFLQLAEGWSEAQVVAAFDAAETRWGGYVAPLQSVGWIRD